MLCRENVGGPVLEKVLSIAKNHARIVACGMVRWEFSLVTVNGSIVSSASWAPQAAPPACDRCCAACQDSTSLQTLQGKKDTQRLHHWLRKQDYVHCSTGCSSRSATVTSAHSTTSKLRLMTVTDVVLSCNPSVMSCSQYELPDSEKYGVKNLTQVRNIV